MTEQIVKMTGYFGSKAASGLFKNIIAMMPPHDTYLETHLGGGAVMQRKPPFSCDYPVRLVNGRAHDFLAHYDYAGAELIYCDPPYLVQTRTGRHRYRFDYTQQHIDLLERLNSLPCAVMLSGYPSSLYDDLLGDWNSLELQAMTWGGPRTEKLWFNYTVDRVHWVSYAGKNFTDRQRIKRKAQRWGEKYRALPRAERLAVLASMMAVESVPPDGTLVSHSVDE